MELSKNQCKIVIMGVLLCVSIILSIAYTARSIKYTKFYSKSIMPDSPPLKMGNDSNSIAFIRQFTNGMSSPASRCKIYDEFRNLPFNDSRIRPYICTNVVLYKRLSNGKYPVCQLAKHNPALQELLNSVRKNSVFTYLAAPGGAQIPIYTYSKEDLISRYIIERHDWENRFSIKLSKIAKSFSDTTFLDIGSNIGVFTLQAMKMNVPTVSFDANIRNLLRLRLSLIANNQKIEERPLIWNFLGNKSILLALSMPLDCNIGGSDRSQGNVIPGRLIDTIKIMPALPKEIGKFIKTRNVVMKMDIEGGEPDFINSSEDLFESFNFLVVTVELLKKNEQLSKFFTSRNYVPFNPHHQLSDGSLKQLDPAAWNSWPVDVWMFKKEYVSQILKVLVNGKG